MSDYIKRDDAIKAMARGIGIPYTDFIEVAERCMDDIQNADVVEIVRCNECIHNVGIRDNTEFYDSDIVCDYWESDGLYSTDYCSYGKRADA